MDESQSSPPGPLLQETSTTPHVLELQRRAKKASNYYHHVLTNGNFRRESDDTENSRRPEDVDQKRHSIDSSDRPSGSAKSQPTTPVRLRPTKGSPAWVKPQNFLDDDEDPADKFRTFPRKIRAQDRMIDSAKSRKPLGFPVQQQGKLVDKTNLASRQSRSTDRLNTVPKSSEDTKKLDAKDARSISSPAKGAASDGKKTEMDFTIVYTLPTGRPKRQQQHYYETVELPHQQREKTHYYETVELPAKKEKTHNYEMINVPSKGLRPNASTGNLKSHSAGSSPNKSPVGDRRRASGMNQLDPNNFDDPSMDNTRLKTQTFSGTTDHMVRVEFRENLSSSNKGSPVVYRRLKTKSRSKSEIVEQHMLINQLQDIESEKDAHKLFVEHIELSAEQARRQRHHFAHFDWKSMLFSFKDVVVAMEALKRKNTVSGASKAATLAVTGLETSSKNSSTTGSQEDVSSNEDHGLIYNRSNDLVANCPYFRNEIGGERDRIITVAASSALSVQIGGHEDSCATHAQSVLTNHTFLSVVEHGLSRMLPPNSPPSGSVRFGIENIDGGALYYKTHFYDTEHQNLVGIDEKYGPIVVSIKREKLVDEIGSFFYQYRLIVRTSELCTLRGSILEDVISGSRLNPSKGYPIKDVIEYVCPEVNTSCLKLAMATPKVQEQIMKVDEHNVQECYKVGVLYCKAGQVTEEEMYNNEHGCEHFERFLQLLGKKVELNGFTEFKGGLDVTTDSTGTESVYTTFNDYQIMFHVSTLLPFTPTNKQQLLRKRHIGNDITTIVFQAPGSEPFNPQHIRSHFQHVFVIVRVHNPCSDNVCYSVAVTRSRNIPRFGPPIPENSMFSCSSTFRDFLLTKVINGENTAHIAGKFKALAMNTRQQYLRDIALNSVSPANNESGPRFARFSITAASKKIRDRDKDKLKAKLMPEELSRGALTWRVVVSDYSTSESLQCIIGISDCVLSVLELDAKKLIFSIPCQAVLGWAVPPPTHEQLTTQERVLHIYFGRGERLSLRTEELESRDEIIIRLERFTKGTETIYRQLRRNPKGELGLNINYEGIVMDIEPNGCADQDSIKQSSRLVEICKVLVATMTHDDIIDLLRTSERVTVVLIPPFCNGTPRKCSKDLYHLRPVLEVKKIDLKIVPAKSRGGSVRRHASQRTERVSHPGSRHPAINQDSVDFYRSHMDTNFNDSTRRRSKRGSRKITDATLIATAAQLALESSENRVSSSSASNTLSSNYSGADVDWVEGSTNTIGSARKNSSSESGFNSNNNSSHTSSLNRSQPTVLSPRDTEKRKPFDFSLNANNNNNNNNNNNLSLRHPSHNISTPSSFTWRPVPKPEELKRKIEAKSSTPSYSFTLSADTVCPVPFKLNWNGTSQSVGNLSSRKTKPHSKKPNTHSTNEPRLRDSIRRRMSQSTQNTSTSGTLDVQSSLIRLLSSESPSKQVTGNSSSSHRSSPKRKLSPLIPSCPLPNRAQDSNQSLASSRKYSPVFRIDDDPYSSDTLQSSLQGDKVSNNEQDKNLPLPRSTKWEEILDTARVAEAMRTPKVRTCDKSSNKLNSTLDSSSRSDKRSKFVNPLYANDSGVSVADPAKTKRSAHIRNRNSSMTSNASESEFRLKNVEKELKILQNKLKQEQDSKRLLEKELSSLRRNNALLLEKVKQNSSLQNGSFINFKKTVES